MAVHGTTLRGCASGRAFGLSARTTLTLPTIQHPKRLKEIGQLFADWALQEFARFEALPTSLGRSLAYRDLTEHRNNKQIVRVLKKLSGDGVVVFGSFAELEIVLSHLLEKQAGGQPGELKTDGSENIFFVRNTDDPALASCVVVSWGAA